MSYYKNNPEISTLLDEMDSAFKEMFICGDDDYAFLKDYIELGLEQMTTMMPNSYEYEFSKARKKQI